MKMIKCKTDEDYEKFAFFFLHNRKAFDHVFDKNYSLSDAVANLYWVIEEDHAVLIINEQDDVIGATFYRYGTRENEFKDQHVVFVIYAILTPEYRGSRVFFRYFKQLIKQMKEENDDIKEFRFPVSRRDKYTQRLYSKFAKVISEIKDEYGVKDIFSVEFTDLWQYLEKFDKKREIKI